MIQLPPELENYWPNRGYYGSLRHNARAVYQRYMGKALLGDTYEQLGYQAESGQDRCFEARGRCYGGGLGLYIGAVSACGYDSPTVDLVVAHPRSIEVALAVRDAYDHGELQSMAR